MKYALLVYVDETGIDPTRTSGPHSPAFVAYVESMVSAGVLTGAERLQPSGMASTVRVANDKTAVLDGPYADTKEQLGGFFIIDVPDLDAALQWAARCPGAARGVVEVRPLWGA